MLNITLTLKHPICDCEQQNLAWGIDYTLGSDFLAHHNVYIRCETCGMKLTKRSLTATLILEEPYPKSQKTTEAKTANVIPLKLVSTEPENDSPPIPE